MADYEVTLDDHVFELSYEPGQGRARLGNQEYAVEATAYGNRVIADVAGKSYSIEVIGGRIYVNGDEQRFAIQRARPRGLARRAGDALHKGAKVKPPMPGRIVTVEVAVGDRVAKGQGLLVLEAMKMQNELTAPTEGLVKAIHCKPGDTVSGDAVVIEIE